MKYELKIIKSMEVLEEEAKNLAQEIAIAKTGYPGFNPDPTKRTDSEWLAHDIRHMRFWNILGWIDGYSSKTLEYEKRHARQQAELDFTYPQLERIFNLVVNSALFGTYYGGAPGYDRGHSILFEAIATNRHSMFYESFPDDLHKRLVNGSFWEMMRYGDCQNYEKLEDVLMNHFNDLKTSFAPEGLELFSRRRFSRKATDLYGAEESGLSKKAILRYGEFVKKLDKRMFELNLSPTDIKPLADSYIDAVNGIDEWECPIFDNYNELRNDTFVVKYSRN